MEENKEMVMEEGLQTQAQTQTQRQAHQQESKDSKHFLSLLLNFTLVLVGAGGPFLLRVYFIHGGSRKWLSSWLQMGAGWPVLLLPLSISYRRRHRHNTKLLSITPRLAGACSVLGLLFGLDCYLFAYSSAYLPVSTSSILFSTQLAFTALFAFFVVRQRFTPYSVNSIILLTLGSVALGLKSGNDRPEGVSSAQYLIGFVMTLAAAALYGLLIPLTQLVYEKSKLKITFPLLMEVSLVISFFSGAFCLVGILANKDFQAIPREAREFGLGESKYYILIVCDAIIWQVCNVGLYGLLLFASALLAGVGTAVLVPLIQLLGVILLHEKLDQLKGLALALSIWGFVSYLYGEHRQMKKMKKLKMKDAAALELPGQ